MFKEKWLEIVKKQIQDGNQPAPVLYAIKRDGTQATLLVPYLVNENNEFDRDSLDLLKIWMLQHGVSEFCAVWDAPTTIDLLILHVIEDKSEQMRLNSAGKIEKMDVSPELLTLISNKSLCDVFSSGEGEALFKLMDEAILKDMDRLWIKELDNGR